MTMLSTEQGILQFLSPLAYVSNLIPQITDAEFRLRARNVLFFIFYQYDKALSTAGKPPTSWYDMINDIDELKYLCDVFIVATDRENERMKLRIIINFYDKFVRNHGPDFMHQMNRIISGW